jgi:hypothetical protein
MVGTGRYCFAASYGHASSGAQAQVEKGAVSLGADIMDGFIE